MAGVIRRHIESRHRRGAKGERMKQFTHDCDLCKFLGHFIGHDVYLADHLSTGASLIARFGDEGPDYHSMPLALFQKQIRENIVWGAGHIGRDVSLPFHEILFHANPVPHFQAWLLALAVNYPGAN